MASLKNSRNILLSNAATRVEGAAVSISTGGISAITVDAGSATPNPASVTLTANTTLYTNPTFAWEFRYGNTGTWTAIGSNSNTLLVTLNAAWLTAAGTNSLVQYRVTVTNAKFNTTTQITSFPILRSGASNITLAYSNDNVGVPISSVGVPNWAGSGGALQVFEGSTALTLNSSVLGTTFPTINGTFNLGITLVSGSSLTLPTITGVSGPTTTIGAWSGNITSKVVYRITAYVRGSGGGTSTVSVDVDLTPLTNGADAQLNYIWTNVPVMYKNSSSASVPGAHSTISIQGRRVVGTTTSNFGWVTVTAAGTTEANTATNTATAPLEFTPASTATASSYTIKLYNSATVSPANLLDTQTIPVVFNGRNPVYIDLTNENASVATDENGNNGVFTLATTSVLLLDGINSVLGSATSVTLTPSAGVTYTYTRNGTAVTNRTAIVALASGTNTLSFRIDSISPQDNGTITVEAVYGGQTYTAVFTVSKVKRGVATPIYEVAPTSSISFSNVTNSFTPTSVTFNALVSQATSLRQAHTTGTISLEHSSDGTTYTALSAATASTITLTTTSLPTTARFVRATLRVGNSTSTIVDQETINIAVIGANGTAGISPPIFEITNDNATVATATDGTGGDYSRAIGVVKLYNGNGVNLLNSITSLTITPSTGVSYRHIRNGTTSAVFSANTSVSTAALTSLSVEVTGISGQDNGTLTVDLIYGGVTYTDTFTVSKVKAGPSGQPAVVYELESNGEFSYNPNTNSFTPTGGVTFSAFSITGNSPRTSFSTGSIVIATSTDGASWADQSTITAATATILPAVLSASTRFVRAQLLVGGVVVDQEVQSISVIGKDGTAGVLLDLTNDNVTVPTDAAGNNGNYDNANTQVQLFTGTTSALNQVTQIVLTPSSGVTFSYNRNGTAVTGQTQVVTLTGTTTSLGLGVTNLASPNDTGSLRVDATFSGQVYSTTFTISKAKAGNAGASPTVYELDASGIFAFNPNTNTFTPTSGVTYTAFSITGNSPRVAITTATIDISKSLDGTNWTLVVTQAGGSATLTPAFLSATDRFIRAELRVNNVIVDTETYPITSIGKDGLSPIIIDLSNDSCAVATNTDGTGGNFANATTQVRINDNSKTPPSVLGQLTSLSLTGSTGVTYSYTRNGTAFNNLAGTSNPTIAGMTSLTVNITAMTQDTGTVTVSAGYSGITYTKDFTVTKVKAGLNATTYEIEANSGILYNNITFQPNNVEFTAYSATGSSPRTLFTGGSIILESTVDGITWTAIGNPPAAVSSRTLTTSSLSATTRQVRARLVVNNVTVDQEIITVSVSGINAVTLELSNDSAIIPSDAQGNNGNYSGTYSTVSLLSGGTSILGQASRITITPSTGLSYKYARVTENPYSNTVSGALTTVTTLTFPATSELSIEVTNLTGDSGTVEISVQYGVIVYSKVLSVAKAKTGPETVIYSIEGSSTVSYDPNTTNFSPATITYTAYSKSGSNNRVTPVVGAPSHYINLLTSTDGTTYSTFSTGSIGNSTLTINTTNLPKTVRFIKAQLYTASGVVADEEIDAITVQGPAGTSGINVGIEPASVVLPADSAGTVSNYSASVSKITVYEGNTPLVYDGVGTSNGRFTVTASTQSNITAGAITLLSEPNVGNIAQVGAASNMSSSDTAKLTFTITGRTSIGTSFTFRVEQTFGKLKSGATGAPGTPGAPGAPGTSGVNLILSRPSTSVFAYANGTVPSYANLDGYARLYEGTTEVTNLATWSAIVPTSSGDEGSINNFNGSPVSGMGIGYYRLTKIGGGLSETGTLIIRATYKGTIYEATFNVTKTRTGYEILNTLPTTNLFEGRMVFLTTDDKLYRYTGTAWTAAVPAGDISGQIISTQIANGAIETAKFASGIEPVTVVAGVPGSLQTRSIYNITDGKLYRWNGTSYTASIAASDIGGIIASAQIAGLEASKVTGQLSSAQIAGLEAAKITGQLANTQIAAVDAAKLTGTLPTNIQVPAVSITGQVGSSQIQAGAITAGKIAANAISSNEIQANAVVAGKIAANAISSNEIQANAIVSDKIAANAVNADQIAANAITSAKIAAGAITAGKIAADSITSNEIAANAITAAEIAAGAITAGKIAAGTIQAADIAAGAITAGKIAANAISASEIQADAITSGKIQAGAVNTAQLAANAVNAEKIAAGSITASKIVAGTITGNEIAANAITAAKIAAGAITADKIQAGSITAATLGVTTLSALTASTGNLTIGTDGSIRTAGSSFNGPGIFLGYDQNAYKFSIGSGAANSPMLSFDGTSLTVPMFGSVERWKFDNSGPSAAANLQGWTLASINANFTSNSIELFSTSSDPIIVFGYNRALDFKGSQYDKIRVRIRRKGGSGWDGTCYYATTGHGISGSFYKTIPNTTILNQWVTLEWDMSQLSAGGSDWTNSTIRIVRLDFGTSSADSFEIDWIAIGRYTSGSIEEINAENSNSIIKSSALGTSQLGYEAVTAFRTASSTTRYANTTGLVMQYSFTVPEAGQIVAFWQAAAASMKYFRFHMYLNATPTSGRPAGYVFVGEGIGDYAYYNDGYGTEQYIFVGAGNGDYSYDPGTSAGAVPSQNVMATVRSGGVFEDAPVMIGTAQARAGLNTIYIWLTEYNGGEIQQGDATNPSQKLIVFTAKR